MNANAPLVQEVLSHLARLGVREVCVAAGARNAPLVAALMASQSVRIWNFFEERCAGFFALGRMQAERAPVAVVTTSGTAAAELLPAVIEAHYQGIPLVVITADRPPEYRQSGAPQAIEQLQLFAAYAGETLDLHESGRSRLWPEKLGPLPLHINVCLEEGITPDLAGIDFEKGPLCEGPFQSSALEQGSSQTEAHAALAQFVSGGEVTVVAGPLHPVHAIQLAPFLEKLGAPLVAEASANLQGHPCLVGSSEACLKGLDPQRVLRVGGVPSWRWWRDLETRQDIPVLNLSPSSYRGLARQENVQTLPLCSGLLGSFDLPDLPHRRQTAERSRVAELDLTLFPLSEPAWLRHLQACFEPGAKVFLGNSLPIRELNLAGSYASAQVSYFANRGANGIDGLVSTFLGLSADEINAPAWLILGDLSALYDLAGPWILNQLPLANRRIVVINNGGGKIFSRVASLRALPEKARQVIENQHQLHFEPWAQLWGLPYRKATRPEHLQDLPAGTVVIEVFPDAAQTEAFWSTHAAA